MSHFRLHTKSKGIRRQNVLIMGIICVLAAAAAGYGIHSMGTARAKSRETVLIYTEEELEQYLLDRESEEYNLNGRYRLEADLELGWLKESIGSNLEPFTGTFDGNGHVINGLERPLFGVMKRAEVENLFLSGAVISHPVLYHDGERYVDGYAGLAGYAVDSVIRNCGVGGEIHMATPMEAEYLLEKASPSDADEEKGPGMQKNPGGQLPSGQESSGPVGPGVGQETESKGETESEAEVGPGVGTESTQTTETESSQATEMESTQTTEMESSQTSEMESTQPTETESTQATGTGAVQPSETESTQPVGTDENGAPETSDGNEKEPETGNGGGSGQGTASPEGENTSEAVTQPGDGTSSTPTQKPETETSNSGTDSSNTTESSGGSDDGTSGETGGGTGVAKTEQTKSEQSEQPKPKQPEQSAATNLSAPRTGQPHFEQPMPVTFSVQAQDAALDETIGYRSVIRQNLSMKAASVVDMDIDEVEMPAATPSDAEESPVATPSDASGPEEGREPAPEPGTEFQPLEDELHYIGNPAGDIYILVTADKITAGGLVAQTDKNTRISNAFTLITIDSSLENIESCVGGLTGILGEEAHVENSYASGLISSSDTVGGFAGINEGIIEHCYSTMTFGEMGNVHGAFTASGSGTLSGCAYDIQMACITEAASEDSLKGLLTAEMTGPETQIPGTWYTTENAYPQIEYFAGHENQMAADSSKMSAIALLLPKGRNLSDILNEGDIFLPQEVDGQEIQWDAGGDLRIDEKNRILSVESATSSSHQVPKVEASLESQTLEPQTTESQTMDPVEEHDPAITQDEPERYEAEPETTQEEQAVNETGSLQLKASIGEITRSYALRAIQPRASYENWKKVGETITTAPAVPNPSKTPGTVDNPYLLKTAEDLAWFVVEVDKGNDTLCANLEADIDLFGGDYTGNTFDSATKNYNDALPWWPIGGGLSNSITDMTSGYKGVFDGKNHVITSLKLAPGLDGVNGFFSRLSGDGIVKNLGIESGYTDIAGKRVVGVVVGIMRSGTILNCWNGATVINGGGETGGIVGYCSGAGTEKIDGCYNIGSINGWSGVYGVGGILGYSWGGGLATISNCYNLGDVTSNISSKTTPTGGIVGGTVSNNVQIQNCYNAGKIEGNAPYALCGNNSTANVTIINSYYDKTYGSSFSHGTPLTTEELQSWAAAYALNGQSRTQATESGLMWVYESAKGYPYLSTESLDMPLSWLDVGKGGMAGLVTAGILSSSEGSASKPHTITTPEQLATLSAMTRAGKSNVSASLEADLQLSGVQYGYSAAAPLTWHPIGEDEAGKRYTGTFNGNGHTVSAMLAKGTEKQGLFGTLGDNATIKKTGISDSQVEASSGVAGGIAGYVRGTNVVITECGNKAGSLSGYGMFFGGCVGLADSNSSLIMDGCYNEGNISVPGGQMMGGIIGYVPSGNARRVVIRNCMNKGKVEGLSYVGGIIGTAVSGTTTITGCWNAGIVSSSEAGRAGSIKGTELDSADELRDCLVDETHKYGDIGNCPTVKSEVLGTWGAAWWLNGGSLKQSTGLSWTYDKDSPYPVLNTMGLSSAESWEVVGQAVDDGLIGEKPTGTPYQISKPEHLAWFAKKINDGTLPANTTAVLKDHLNLAGTSYVSSGKLAWVPIGKDASHSYQGTFQSDTGNAKIYEIQDLYVNTTGEAGLFGNVDTGGVIQRIGIKGASVAGKTSGGIAGMLKGTAEISQCYNRGASSVSGTSYAGGIAGQVTGSAKIRDCYHLDSVVSGTGTTSYAGGIAGGIPSSGSAGVVQNSYNACGTTGGITISGGGAAGSIAGSGTSGSSVVRCYSEELLTGESTGVVTKLDASTNKKIWEQTDGLNTTADGERVGTGRVWYTSLASEATRGLPTFDAPQTISITLNAADADTGRSETLPTSITGALLRGIHQENTNEASFESESAATVAGQFSRYGSVNANKYIGFKAGNVDLGALTASLRQPTGSAGTVSQLTLYTGAAYTLGTARVVLLDFAGTSGGRYEVRVTIPAVTSKTLSVELTRNVTVNLTPDSTKHKDYSNDASIMNHGNYPVEGGIISLTPLSGGSYVELTPVFEESKLSGDKWITDSAGGVRVGIAEPAANKGGIIPADGLYYNPASPGAWMNCRLKGNGTLRYRYFMEYTAYFNFWENDYGYDVNYQFQVAENDFTANSGEAQLVP